jgi:uncharacterized protein with beta-barrel porin domain
MFMGMYSSSTRGGDGDAGISLNGGINTINNSSNASIQGGSYGLGTGSMMYNQAMSGNGINLSGGTTAITNRGTIVGAAGGNTTTYGIRLTESANISTLTNLQGGNNALSYYGALPSTYNIIVQSSTNFGSLAVAWSSGSLAFGVDSTSTLEANRYLNALTGVNASAITNEDTEFLLGSFAWSLVAGSTANSWDLLVSFRGLGAGTTTDIATSSTTAFAGGTLLVSSSGQYGQNWSLGTQATNTMDLGGNRSTFSGVLSDLNSGQPGNIIFSNVGSAVLTAISTYTGTTTIGNGATVAVNGSIASSSGLTVNSGGIVGGTGTLPTTTIANGGFIAPGNSIGTINVAGNYSLNGGSIQAEIQGPQNDQIVVTGNVNPFTGTASLISFGGGTAWPSFDYQIVTANASAPFATANSLTLDQSQITPSALLRLGTTLIQEADGNPNTFDVQWQPRNGSGATASAMQTLGQGYSNQLATAGAVDRVFRSLANNAANNTNNTGSLIGSTGFTTGQAAAAGISADFLSATSQLLSLASDSQLTAAINSLSPEPYAAFQSVGLDTLKRQRELLLSQAGTCTSTGWVVNAPTSKKGKPPKQPLCVFAQAANATSSINGQSGLSSYDSGIFSTYYGVEYKPAKPWTIGAAYGYGTSYLNNMTLTNAVVSSGVNSGSLYGVYKPSEPWTIRGLFGYSNFNTTGSRNVAYIGNGSAITATPPANGYTAAINADYLIQLTKPTAKTAAFIKPLLGIAWGGYQQGSFSEVSSSALNLNVDSNTANSLMGTVGIELLSAPIALNRAKTTAIKPRLAIAYQVDAFGNYTNVKSLTSSFAQAPAAGSFTTEGENRGVNTLTLDGGVEFQLASNTSVYANVGYEAFSTGAQFTYGGGFKVKL